MMLAPIVTDQQIRTIADKAACSQLGMNRNDPVKKDDAVADAMFGIAQGLAKVDRNREPWEIEAYLLASAKGAVIAGYHERAHGSRRVPQRVESLDWLRDEMEFDIRSPQDWIKRIDDLLLADQALRLMSQLERRIVIAHYVQGYSHAEIASITGVSAPYCSQAAVAACRRVRRQLLLAQRLVAA